MRSSSSFFLGLPLALALCAIAASPVAAQRTVAFDTVSESTPAAISCGFCAGEKFGVVFRELSGGTGLRASEFPLTINSFQIGIASATVALNLETFMEECQGSAAGGTVGVTLEAYAGETAPTGSILDKPADGPWAGETMVFAESVELERSVETTPGSAMYNVMINTVTVDGGAMVAAPNTYIRVVATIPSGGSSSSCEFLSLGPPGAVGIRDDDGRIENEVDFIYAVNPVPGLGGIPQGWHWNESGMITGPGGGSTIAGDWLLRMDISPASGPTPDAGVSDSGVSDAGSDGGIGVDTGTPTNDGGGMGCTMDSECAGGERCASGMCERVTCTTASECGGGMTCVDGRCRSLCGSDSECSGGEVCDTVAGSCVPVGSGGDDGGCGCAVHRPRDGAPLGLLFLGLGVLAWRRQRRR